MYSTPGEIEIAPRRCAPGAGQAREVGQAVEREVHLARRAAAACSGAPPRGSRVEQLPGSDQLQERAVRVDARDHDARRRSPRRSRARRPSARPSFDHDRARRGASVRISTPASRAAPAMAIADRAGAAAREAPGAERAVDLAHVVVQQHVGRARRAHAEERADDPARRHRGLQHVGLEPLVEQVGRAHGHELEQVVLVGRGEAPGSAGPAAQSRARPRHVAATAGRAAPWTRIGLTKRAMSRHRLRVLVVGLGVARASGGRSRGASARGRSCATGSRRSASA